MTAFTFQLGEDRLTVPLDPEVLAELVSRGFGVEDGMSLAKLDEDLFALEIATELYEVKIYLTDDDMEALKDARPAPEEE